ncbi:Lsr2 family protein [Streptomyces sp. NPDC059080]|uniref:histone-like nucleoid-structuring protein Lsr2 n=1 Tax=Streptomyces sp. NPDC059080 TaxID=3346718 RepID=UPI0036A7088E
MAQRTIVTLIDDLNPGAEIEAAETVAFALDGVHYEIDLSAENAHTLRARLKQFTQAGRIVTSVPKRTQRTTAEAASTTTSLSRTQSGTDPAVIGAWAVEKGLREPGKPGRISNSIKDAYAASQAGDDGPLNELRARIRAVGSATEPVKQLDHSVAATATVETKDTEGFSDNPDEAEARKHYKPNTRFSPQMDDPKKWARRTCSGHPQGIDKVEKWTLMDRINALSSQHLTILGQLAGIIPTKTGKISYLKTSDMRLQNLEVIEYDPESPCLWTITDFGRYAHQVRSIGE